MTEEERERVRQAPERIYMHPTSAEANINPWPLEPGEYVEYIRADLLTTAREEEREAAFKVICVDCAEGDTPILDQQARWYYHGEGNEAVGCSASKLRLEAAASTKGENDG